MLHVEIGKALAFDFTPESIDTLLSHEAVKARILKIGLRNILMDSHASIVREDFETEVEWRNTAKALAEKSLAAMLAGEVRSIGSGPRASAADPVAAEALRMARVWVHANRKAGLAKWSLAFELPMATPNDEKAIIVEAQRRYAAKPDVIAAAEAAVEAKSAVKTDNIDL